MCVLPLVNPGSAKMDKGTMHLHKAQVTTNVRPKKKKKKEELVTWKKSFKIFENGGNKLKELKLTW